MVIHIVTDILALSPKLTDVLRAKHNWLELLFCSQCLAGQLLAPTYFWRAHKYSTKILCSSPLVLEMKAVGGSRTDFCLELEQLLHLQTWDSPGLIRVSCLTPGLTGILSGNGTLSGLINTFGHQFSPNTLRSVLCSGVGAAGVSLGMCDSPDLTMTPWKAHKDEHLPQPNILQQLLSPVDPLDCPMWAFQHREASGKKLSLVLYLLY